MRFGPTQGGQTALPPLCAVAALLCDSVLLWGNMHEALVSLSTHCPATLSCHWRVHETGSGTAALSTHCLSGSGSSPFTGLPGQGMSGDWSSQIEPS